MSQSVSFERPPVVETVLCVQFDRLGDLEHRHLAAYWASLGKQWPYVDFLPEIAPTYEEFDEVASWAQMGPSVTVGHPRLRLQIKNVRQDRMIQVQNGRLVQNWLGQGGKDYPRYASLRPEFEKQLDKFTSFLHKQQLPSVSANQWEVTYVNHIPKGSVWETPTDWGNLLPPLFGTGEVSADWPLEGLGRGCVWRFEIRPQRGRLHVSAEHRRVGAEQKQEALVLKLTARGPVTDKASLHDGLDLGHETIVNAFYSMTSKEAHGYWGEIA